MIELTIHTVLHPEFPLSRRELLPVLKDITEATGLSHRSFVLRLVDDVTVAAYNAAFMGLSGPTNILSFPAQDFPEGTLPEDPLSLDCPTADQCFEAAGPEVFELSTLTDLSDFESEEEFLSEAVLECEESDGLMELQCSPFLGELILSVETMDRESHLYGQDPVIHMVRLITHGLLHLAGYDHGEEMYSLTEKAVQSLCCAADEDSSV